MKRTTVLPLSLLLVLTGCAVSPGAPGLIIKPLTKDGMAQATQTQSADAPAVQNQASTNAQGTVNINRSGGTSVNTTVDLTVPNGATTSGGTGVIVGTPQAISAVSGGRYVSADGQLSAEVPPGALTQDAVIHISAIDTAAEKLAVGFVPGIRFTVDLGGARLTAD